ncbi:MAG TPA: response regulator transcription factor [Chitinophagaceae bacterium]
MAKVALVDDHVLLRKGLASLLEDLDHDVVCQADNGKAFTEQLSGTTLPEVVLLDINMPVMDGYQTAQWLKQHHPDIRVLALSMNDDEHAMIRMLKNGARGYVLKDCEPQELRTAIHALMTKGYYHSEMVTARLIHSLAHMEDEGSTTKQLMGLNDKEIHFLKLACTEMTYKEIADQMGLSPRTIDGYRDGLFEKLGIKSRVGLVLFAIKNGVVTV